MANPAPGWKQYPNHRVAILPWTNQVTVCYQQTLVAQSSRALAVDEARYPVAYYLPWEDVQEKWFKPSATQTYCPFKGHAVYHHLQMGDHHVEDVLWSYAEPYDECSALRGYVAFYPDKVDIQTDSS